MHVGYIVKIQSQSSFVNEREIMKTGIIILALFSASVLGQTCPECPPPVIPPDCQEPDCMLPENRQNIALFPHPDPNYYWQCMPWNATVTWVAVARPCACGTVFNPNVFPPRCTFWDDRNWRVQCNWVRPPVLRPCDPWCPDCGDDVPGPSPPTTQPPPGPGPGPNPDPSPTPNPTPGPVPDPTPPSCNCPCIPCIWWPCIPCNPCACNQG